MATDEFFMDLIIVALLTGAAAIAVGVAGPPDAVRIALMLPLVFFTPGYALVSALYPGRADLSPLERLAISFAVSLAILPLIALALNYSPWGVRWEPLMAFVSLLVVVASALGLLHRRYGRPPGERFAPSLRLNLPRAVTVRGVLRGTAFVVVIAPLTVVAVVLLVILAGQRAGDAPHTEFYLLGSDGRPDSLPRTLMVGENVSLIIGITNREAEEEWYAITASIGGSPVQEISGVRLAPGQSWKWPFVLTPERPGNWQRVQFDLHMEGAGGGVYRTLRIWVDVLEPL
ncbi:MAG: DUF1616 domain-containing protein, partial [Dehalococcoidia bacterium]